MLAIVRNPQAEPVKSIDFRGPEHQRDPRFVVERFFRTRRLEDFHIDRVVGPGGVAHEQADIGGQALLDQFSSADLPVASRGVVLELGDLGPDLANLLFELGTSLSLLWRADQCFATAAAIEDGQHRIVIALRNGVVFMVMAACTPERETEEDLGSRGNDVIEFVPTVLFQTLVTDGGSVSAESGCYQRLEISGRDFVARDLFHHELVVRFVGVQAVDHPVAVVPGVRSFEIKFEAVGIRIAGQVEPVAAPPFTVVG